MKKIILIILAMFISMGAKAEEDNKLKISGKLWSQFSYDSTNYPDAGKSPSLSTANKLGFDIYRAYFIANYKFDDLWSSLLVLDASRSAVTTTATDTTAQQVVYIKDMFVQNSNIFQSDIRMRFGYFNIMYAETLDKLMGTRWLATNLNDTAVGGITINGLKTVGLTPAHAGGLELYRESGGFLRYALTIHNGVEGTNLTGNTDNGLSFMATLDVLPFHHTEGSLKTLGLLVSYDNLAPSRKSNSTLSTPSTSINVSEGANLLEVALHYQSSIFDGAFEFAHQTENQLTDPSQGWGVMGNLKLLEEQLGFFVKYNTGTTQFQNNKLGFAYILDMGPTWTFTKGKLMTGLLYEVKAPSQNTFLNASTNSLVVTTSTFLWKWAANF